MNTPALYQLLADAVLIVHMALVLFVVVGLFLIVLGNLRQWFWVNSPGFRFAHLATISIVVAESWLQIDCPLTILEAWLREKAQLTAYSGSFIEHWLHALLFWQAPAWIFTTAYTLFGLAVIAVWWLFPPRFNCTTHKANT